MSERDTDPPTDAVTPLQWIDPASIVSVDSRPIAVGDRVVDATENDLFVGVVLFIDDDPVNPDVLMRLDIGTNRLTRLSALTREDSADAE